MNGTLVKNQLIFDFASGALGPAKSLFASTYLYLNSRASRINRTFEGLLGENLLDVKGIPVSKIKYSDCISKEDTLENNQKNNNDPLTMVFGPIKDIKWKQIYKGFNEFSPDFNDKDELKLIKMDPGVSVPIHSHGAKNIF